MKIPHGVTIHIINASFYNNVAIICDKITDIPLTSLLLSIQYRRFSTKPVNKFNSLFLMLLDFLNFCWNPINSNTHSLIRIDRQKKRLLQKGGKLRKLGFIIYDNVPLSTFGVTFCNVNVIIQVQSINQLKY